MAVSNRFQPPADGANPQEQFQQLSGVVDQLALLAAYKPVQDAVVSVSAGDFRRLTPRATGQNVVIPTADGSNIGKRITLIVETTLGTCRVRAVTGTINGSTSFTLAAGYVALIELVSNGNGRWVTTRASGYPTAGNALSYTGNTLNYVGSTSTINITPTSGALGVVDITTLQAGGTLTFQSVSPTTIDGFTVKPEGFWFFLYNRDSTSSDSIRLRENVGSAVTSMRTPNTRDWRLSKNDGAILVYSNSRWRVIASRDVMYLRQSDGITLAAQSDNYTRSDSVVQDLRFTLTGNQTLTGVVPEGSAPDGQILSIFNADTVDTLTLAHDATSTAANRFLLPDGVNMKLGPISGALFRYDDDSSQRWRYIGPSPHGRLLTRTVLTSGTGATFTHNPEARFCLIEGVGGGGAGGGRAAGAGSGGSCGGSGTWGRRLFVITATTSTYTVGAAGTGVSGATGNAGTSSTWLHNATTTTLPAGAGGVFRAAAAGPAYVQGGLGGGAANNADDAVFGQRGAALFMPAAAVQPMVHQGHAGSTPIGMGGVGSGCLATANVNGDGGTGYGAGASGALQGAAGAAGAGPTGQPGVWIVLEFS